MNVVVARAFGAEGTGAFFGALSIFLYATSISRLGTDQVLLRTIARERASHGTDQRNQYILSLLATGLLSLVLSGFLFLLAQRFVSDNGERSVGILQILAWVVLPSTWTWLHSGMLKGAGRINTGIILDLIWIPLGVVSCVMIFAVGDVNTLAHIYQFGVCSALLVSVFLVFREFGFVVPSGPLKIDPKFLRSSLAFTVITIVNSLANWLPVTIAVALLSAADAGAISMAIRVSAVGTLVLSALNSVAAHRFASLYATGDMPGLQRATTSLTALGFLVTCPVLLGMIIFPSQVMGLFGPDFVSAAPLLVICALGQLVFTAAGMASPLLSMTGNERYVRNVLAVNVGVLAATCTLSALIQSKGLIALSVAVYLVVQSILICYFAWRRVGIRAWFDPIMFFRQIARHS